MSFKLEALKITRIRGIFNVNIKEKCCKSRTDRTRPALVFKLAGSTEYFCNDKSFVCDEHHVLIVPNGKPYIYEIRETGPCISIEFECENEIDDFYSYKITDNTKVRSVLADMVQLWNAKSRGYKLALFADFYILLHTVFILSNVEYNVKKKENVLRPSVTYIQNNYGESSITNEMLAELSGMSTVYFRKLFTKRYGLSPMKYLSNIRIENAKNLLLAGNMSASEIAEAIGFSSVYSFSRAFKKATDMSPTEFVKANKNFSL